MIKRISILILATIFLAACNGGQGGAVVDSDALPVEREQYLVKCHLSGSNIAKEYPEVFVFRADQSAFMNRETPVATFRVKNGCFDGSAMLDTTLVYELIFTVPKSGIAAVRPFVPTVKGVSVVGPESLEADSQLQSDTPENECLIGYEDIFRQQLPMASKQDPDTFMVYLDSLFRQYVADHPSIGSFHWLRSNLEAARNDAAKQQPWIDLYDSTYAALFPDHPYHSMILSMTSNRVGDRIHDFTLPDEKGVQRMLSELTAGKLAVVDFWASWCGSCRTRSKALIPIYEKYASDNFTMVGVALEYKNDAAWRKALARDGYPWLNLIALDAAPSLKANHSKAFVLDPDGTILAIDPTPEELDTLLQEKLQR